MKILQAKRAVDNYLDVLLDDGRNVTVQDNHPKVQEWIAQGNSIEEPTTAHKIGVAKAEKRIEIKQYAQSLVDELETDIEADLRRARMDYYLVQIADGNSLPAALFDKDRTTVNQIASIYNTARTAIQNVNSMTTVTEVEAVDVSALGWPT